MKIIARAIVAMLANQICGPALGWTAALLLQLRAQQQHLPSLRPNLAENL